VVIDFAPHCFFVWFFFCCSIFSSSDIYCFFRLSFLHNCFFCHCQARISYNPSSPATTALVSFGTGATLSQNVRVSFNPFNLKVGSQIMQPLLDAISGKKDFYVGLATATGRFTVNF
jgi:hypothetical protein